MVSIISNNAPTLNRVRVPMELHVILDFVPVLVILVERDISAKFPSPYSPIILLTAGRNRQHRIPRS